MPRSAKLPCVWVFWLDRWTTSSHASGGQIHHQHSQTITELGEAATARDFWALLSHNPVDSLQDHCSLHVFRKHVKPEWEDPHNIQGGHFRFMNIKPLEVSNESKLWNALVVKAVGEEFHLSSSVVGVGLSNKGKQKGKVVSLWLNCVDSAVVKAFQTELTVAVADNFLCRFVQHSTLRHEEFTLQQHLQHRRFLSAPVEGVGASSGPLSGQTSHRSPKHGAFISIDYDADDTAAAAAAAPPSAAAAVQSGGGSGVAFSGTAEPTSPMTPKKVRRPPSPLRHGIKLHQAEDSDDGDDDPGTVAAGKGAGGGGPHHRSKSANEAVDVLPQQLGLLKQTKRGTPPPGGEESQLTSTASSGVYPPVKAPTPLKVWADQWSPSLLYAAMGVKPPLAAPGSSSQGDASTGTKDGTGDEASGGTRQAKKKTHQRPAPVVHAAVTTSEPPEVPAPTHSLATVTMPPIHPSVVVGMPPPPPGMAYYPPPLAVHGGAGMAYPFSMYPPPIGGGFVGGPPTAMVPYSLAVPPSRGTKSLSSSASPAATANRVPTKSDSSAFVHAGYLFPSGLNRKERRRIIFSGEVDPASYPGTTFVGEDYVLPEGSDTGDAKQ